MTWVLPALAGMSPTRMFALRTCGRAPRASGDEPHRPGNTKKPGTCSPR